MRLIEVIHQRLMAERYQHRTPYKEVLKSINGNGVYWDTGYTMTSDVVEYGIRVFGVQQNGTALFGSEVSVSTAYSGVPYKSSAVGLFIGGTQGVAQVTFLANAENTYIVKTTSSTAGTVTLNGTTSSFTYAGGIQKSLPIYLSANNKGSAIQVSSIPIHYFYIKDNGVKVRDMIPVLDWNDRPCFFDRVRKEFIYHSGTGTPTYERWNKLDVDYLQSDGSQWIDTGLYGDNDTEMEIDVKSTSTTQQRFMGHYSNATVSIALFPGPNTTRFGNANVTGVTHTENVRANYVLKDTGVYINGVKNKTLNPTNTFTTTGTLLIGNTTTSSAGLIGQIYSAKIRENDNLMRDYIPCVHNSKGAMYDQIENKMYYNANTSATTGFKAYIEYDGVSYEVGQSITSSGAYINTGITMSNDVSFIANVGTTARTKIGLNCDSVGLVVWQYQQERKTFNFRYKDSNGTTRTQDYGVAYEENTLYRVEFNVDGKFKVDDNSPMTKSYTISNAYTSTILTGTTDIYARLEMFVGAEKIRDFIPVKKSDGTIGMLDLVTRTLFTNSGTGSFAFNQLSP